MKILFLLPQIPYPPHSGGRIVTWNTIKRFAQTCEVSVVCLYHHPSELAFLADVKAICHECAAFPAHGKWSLATLLRSLLSLKPYKAHRFFNRNMFDYVRRLLRRECFDVIHAQNFYTTSYITGDEDALKVHYKENVEGQLLLRYARAAWNPLIKAAAWLEGMRTRCFEVRACRKFNQVLTISPLDRDLLLDLDPALAVLHQRPGVDLGEYQYWNDQVETPKVVFTGTMSYYPNTDGILEFLRMAWPRIRREVSTAECYIVGASPSRAVKRLDGQDGVHVTGRVPDVQAYLKQAWVFIVPLRIGGGIRLKILEAMAAGVPIVSTHIGCEGLDGKHGRHLMIEDHFEDFADAVVELIGDREKREQIRDSARALIEEVYDWDIVIERQQSLYYSLVQEWASVEHPLP